jgi:cytochrome P450
MPAATLANFRSPPGTLLWGHRAAMISDQIGFIERAKRECGDVVPLRVGPIRMWLISDPAMIGEILTTRAASFRKDMGIRRMKVLLGEGLLTAEGEEHDRNHRLAQPAFRQKEVERYAAAMVETTERVLSGWGEGERVDLAAELSRLALGIVGRALFGADMLAEGREIGRSFSTSSSAFGGDGPGGTGCTLAGAGNPGGGDGGSAASPHGGS